MLCGRRSIWARRVTTVRGGETNSSQEARGDSRLDLGVNADFAHARGSASWRVGDVEEALAALAAFAATAAADNRRRVRACGAPSVPPPAVLTSLGARPCPLRALRDRGRRDRRSGGERRRRARSAEVRFATPLARAAVVPAGPGPDAPLGDHLLGVRRRIGRVDADAVPERVLGEVAAPARGGHPRRAGPARGCGRGRSRRAAPDTHRTRPHRTRRATRTMINSPWARTTGMIKRRRVRAEALRGARAGAARTAGTRFGDSAGSRDRAPVPAAYRALGVSRDADARSIRRAYRRAAATWHPDKWTTRSEARRARRRRRSAASPARTALGDAKRRRAYDADPGRFRE